MLLKPNGQPLNPKDAERAIIQGLHNAAASAQARLQEAGSGRVILLLTCPNAQEVKAVSQMVRAAPKVLEVLEYLKEQAERANSEADHPAYRAYCDAADSLTEALKGGGEP